MVGDVGRTELVASAEKGARDLFRSLARLKALPDYLEVLPGALAGSVCGRGLSGNPASTIGFERRNNTAFRIDDEEAFVARMLKDIPPPPRAAEFRAANAGLAWRNLRPQSALQQIVAGWSNPMRRVSGLVVAAAGAAVALAPSWAFAQQPQESNEFGYGPYMMMDWAGGWYGMFFGPLLMILVLGLVIAVAVVIVRGLGGPPQWAPPPHQTPPERTPLDILKERYARGEIDKDEFLERRRVLGD